MDQTVLYQYTARTILTCSSTCPALSVVYWPSVEWHMKKLLTKMECGVYRINLQRKELLNVSWMFTKYLSNQRVRQILVVSGSTTFNKVTIVTDVVMVTGVIIWWTDNEPVEHCTDWSNDILYRINNEHSWNVRHNLVNCEIMVCVVLITWCCRLHSHSRILPTDINITHIKIGLNSKMPSRFPPVLFNAP